MAEKSCYFVEGGNILSGEVAISGSKNAVLPILAAAAIQGEAVITNVPFLSDVSNTLSIMKKLGLQLNIEGNIITTRGLPTKISLDRDLSGAMRSSILFLGALLGKFGEVEIYEPGGCKLGERPIDLHLWAMKEMGAEIKEEGDKIICKGMLKGTTINMPSVSVGVTENIILAAINAKGTTIINNSALEPEIDDLILFLNKCGCKITRKGRTIAIENSLTQSVPCHSIVPDRIETGTFCAVAAITGGELFITHAKPKELTAVLSLLMGMGCIIKVEPNSIYIDAPSKLYSPQRISTGVYPHFPTDMQPIITAVAAVSEGVTEISENIFSARNKHIAELNAMGANISLNDNRHFKVEGVPRLMGTTVRATDLRSGAALVVAGLSAEGITTVEDSFYIERGYEALCAKLSLVGGSITSNKR